MSAFFLELFNMSISAAWVVLAVLLLRLMLKKAPKRINVLLWSIAALRLVCPFSIESAWSLLPSAQTLPHEVLSGPSFDVQTGISPVDERINNYLGDYYFEGVTVPAKSSFNVTEFAFAVWLIGVLLMLTYAAVSWWRLCRKVDTAVRYRDNIYQSEAVTSPFVLGFIRAKIYIPFHLPERDLRYVTAHEQTHIRRKDHWWKPLGFLLLAIHWFNPLIWLAYLLFCRDIEFACDERVIKDLDSEQRADYAQALVDCSMNRRRIAASPLAFGEVGVKERVRSVMNYRKPAFWGIILAVIVFAAAAVCFLTNPKQDRYTLRIVVPAGSQEKYVYSKEEISTTGNSIKIWSGDGLEDTEVLLSPVDGAAETGSAPAYLTQGMPVKFDVERDVWFRIGVNVQNPTDTDRIVYVDADHVEVRVSSQAFEGTYALQDAIEQSILKHFSPEKPDGLFHVESHILLSSEAVGETSRLAEDELSKQETAYLLVFHETYSTFEGKVQSVGGTCVPTAITFDVDENGRYSLNDYWEPRDGSHFAQDVRRKFPPDAADMALDAEKYAEQLEKENYQKALSLLEANGSLDIRIAELFAAIQTSPVTASAPKDYIAAHEAEHQELISYGEYTLRYCFSEFLQGGQTGLHGQIMRILLDDIAPESKLKLYAETGQDYFDEWKNAAISISQQHDPEWIQKNQPSVFLMLQMLDERIPLDRETVLPDGESIDPMKVFAAILSGDHRVLAAGQEESWFIPDFQDETLRYEYLCMDLDGDLKEELLVQMPDDPAGYNGVFHLENGRVFCWNSDASEGSVRDYPLTDGTMVRQSDFNGTRSYINFRYLENGEREELFTLFARDEEISPNSTEPCPYYAIDGREVEQEEFDRELRRLIMDRRIAPSAWKDAANSSAFYPHS